MTAEQSQNSDRSHAFEPIPMAVNSTSASDGDEDDVSFTRSRIDLDMDSDDDVAFYSSGMKTKQKWWKSIEVQFMIGACLAIGLVALALIFLPHGHHRKHVNDLSYHGLYGDIQTLQESDVHNWQNRTLYGADLRPWELDTSREYFLSKNGLWDVNQPPTTRRFVFNITDIVAAPDGVEKQMTVINGKFPGPVVEANEGDRIIVEVNNFGKDPTTIHFHGLHFNGSNYMDGAASVNQCPIPPGKSFTYDFNLTQYGTYWYHSHYSTQYLEGVAGPVVIHSKKEQEVYSYDEEVVIFLSDLYHKNSFDLIKEYIAPGKENEEPVPDSGLIQGTNRLKCELVGKEYNCKESREAVIPVRDEKRYRFRLISAGGFSEFDFSIDNHTMQVIETDGTNTEPLDIDVIRLSNAQRYSVLVDMDQKKGSFWIRATMNTYCYDGDSKYLDTDLKAYLTYPDVTQKMLANGGIVEDKPGNHKHQDLAGSVSCVELNASLLSPQFPEPVLAPTMFVQLDATFQIGARTITLGYFNETSYKPLASRQDNVLKTILSDDQIKFDAHDYNPSWAEKQMMITIPQYAVVDLLINNYDDGAHPFHLHGHRFWVLDYGKGYFDWDKYQESQNMQLEKAIQRDTVQVDKFGWALIRFVSDNPGVWLFHCHVVWHHAAGLAMQFVTQPNELQKQVPPKEWYDICNANPPKHRM